MRARLTGAPKPMPFDVPAFVEKLPVLAQVAVYLMLAAATISLGVRAYYDGRKKADAPASAPDMVLTAATLSDMKPVRELVMGVDRLTGECARIANLVESLLELKQAEADDEDYEKEVQRRLREERGEDVPPLRRRPRRKPD